MEIICLLDNVGESEKTDLINGHGLSIYLKTDKHHILIDTGSNDNFAINAAKLNVDLTKVDIVIITHGHSDHGGGLKHFLKINNTAKIYIQKEAFTPHFTKLFKLFKINIGLDPDLMNSNQVVLLEGDFTIDQQITLITNPPSKNYLPKFNNSLYQKNNNKLELDQFNHEQSVLIKENKTVLISSCSHRGIINIVENAQSKAKAKIDIVIGGFHLFNPVTKKSESTAKIIELAKLLQRSDIQYYTCHCSGTFGFAVLRKIITKQIEYLFTGRIIKL